MTAKGWTLQQLIEHERAVELFFEGQRGLDIKRWKKDASFDDYYYRWGKMKEKYEKRQIWRASMRNG